MKGPTHELIGVTVAIIGCQATHQTLPVTGIVTAGTYLASRLPDRLECGILPHRTVTHMPFIALPLLAIIAAAAILTIGAAGVITAASLTAGYTAHLAADGCTPHGLPGWPLLPRIWLLPRPLRITTGSTVETMLAAVIVAALAAELYMAYGR